MFGGIPGVQADEVALPVARLGGFVVEPDGGAEAAGGLGGQREGVAGGVAEAGGDLAVAGVEPLLGEQVGLGDAVLSTRQPIEDPAVGQGAARHGLDVAEVGAGQAEADGGVRAEAVAGFQYDESAPGAHEGGAGPQQLPGAPRRARPYGPGVRSARAGW